MKNAPTILIAIHSLFTSSSEPISGTGSSLFGLLRQKHILFSCIHFPIYGGHKIRVDDYDGITSRTSRHGVSPPGLFRRTIMEGKFFLDMIRRESRIDVYIGIDPINAMWGIFGKYIFRKIGKVIYYTADYADQRFGNPILNGMYHVSDWISRTYANQVWNVSTRITEKRKEQGVPVDRNYFIPNTPIYHKHGMKKFDKFRLIVVGTSVTALEFSSIFESLHVLAHEYPKISLHIVGELHFTNGLKNRLDTLRRSKRVVTHGALSHDAVSKLLSTSGIGVALYKDKDPWTRYGDSMKIREYLAAGIPVIATDIVSTSSVIDEYGCGKVTGTSADEFTQAVRSILDSVTYDRMRKNALRAAYRYSFDSMVRVPLSLVGITV